MKKNYMQVIMIVFLAIVVVKNVADAVNGIVNAAPVNWSLYTIIYAALTISFSDMAKKKKANK